MKLYNCILKMKIIISILLFCLMFSITKGQISMGIGISGGIPINKTISKNYSFAYGGNLWICGTEEHRLSYSGVTFGFDNFNKKNNAIIKDSIYMDLSRNYYIETGLKLDVLNNFYIGVDVGYNLLYKIHGDYYTDFSLTPQFSYSLNKIIIFEKTRFILSNSDLSTINIGINLKLF